MVKIIENIEKNGVELYFDSMPARELINKLKENFFRWHNAKKCWYTKVTEQARKFISTLEDVEAGQVTALAKNCKQNTTTAAQSVYKYSYNGITTQDGEYIKGYYNINNLTYVINIYLDTYKCLKDTPNGTYQKNDSDIMTDYFEKTDLNILPESKEYLNALNGYIKQIEHSDKINARYYEKHPKAYRTYTEEQQKATKENNDKIIAKAKELATNYLTMDYEQASKIYNDLVNSNKKAEQEKQEQQQLESTKYRIKELQAKKEDLQNGKYCYYDEILENDNFIIAISKQEYNIIDFTPHCMDKTYIDYTINAINKNTFTSEFITVKTEDEKQNAIKKYLA